MLNRFVSKIKVSKSSILNRNFFMGMYFKKKNKEKRAEMEHEWNEKQKQLIQGTGNFEGSIYSQYRMMADIEGKFLKSPEKFENLGIKFPKLHKFQNLAETNKELNLNDGKKHIVLMASSGSAQKFNELWMEGIKKIEEESTSNSQNKYSIEQILLIEKNLFILKFLKNSMLNKLRESTPKEYHENYFWCMGDFTDEKKIINYKYESTNYIYFVDQFGRIKWTATGKPG